MKSASVVALLAALASEPFLAQDRTIAQPSFRSASEQVMLPVIVTDQQGGFVRGLSKDQFVVHDNRRAQAITLFDNRDIPVSVALVLDNSGSMRGRLGEVVLATLAFARASNPHDELFAVEFNDRVRDALGGGTLVAHEQSELEAALRALEPAGQTALYDGLASALGKLESARHARKVLVLLSDGGDNASRSATLDQVLARAHESDVTIFTIGLFDPASRDTNPSVLKKLADTTGGERLLPQSPGALLKACERVAHALRTSYMIGYAPPATDGAYHRVQVRIVDPGGRRLRVRTRLGYVAPKE